MRFPHLASLVRPYGNLEPKQSGTTETDNGTAIVLTTEGQFHSGLALCHVGAPTGAPTSFSVAWKVQESADGTTWTDVPGAALTMTAAGVGEIDCFPNQLKEQMRLVRTTNIVGGTTPKVPTAGTILLGAGRTNPV